MQRILITVLKLLKIICPAFPLVTEDPILNLYLCLINYWFSQYCDLNRKDYLLLSNRCLSYITE